MKAALRSTALVAVTVLLVGMPVARAYAQAPVTWKGYTYNPAAVTPTYQGLERIAAEMAKSTDGKFTIQMNVGGSLPIRTDNITQVVGEGIIQFGSDGFFIGNVPIGGLLRLPMLLRTPEEYAKAAEIMAPYLEEAFAQKGAIVLAQYIYPLQVAFSSQKLISLADIKGQKLRVTSPEQSEFVRRFGGIPVTVNAPEVPPALQRGVVSGVFTASAGGGRIWKDMLSHNYRLGLNWFNSMIIANKEAYRSLPPEWQKALKAAAVREGQKITEAMREDEATLTAKFAKDGMVVTNPKDSEVIEAEKRMASFWNEWARKHGPKTMEALKKVRTAIGK